MRLPLLAAPRRHQPGPERVRALSPLYLPSGLPSLPDLRPSDDELVIKEIRDTNPFSETLYIGTSTFGFSEPLVPGSDPSPLADSRPLVNAVANAALNGAGFETGYQGCQIKFFGIPNIHAMRDAYLFVFVAVGSSFICSPQASQATGGGGVERRGALAPECGGDSVAGVHAPNHDRRPLPRRKNRSRTGLRPLSLQCALLRDCIDLVSIFCFDTSTIYVGFLVRAILISWIQATAGTEPRRWWRWASSAWIPTSAPSRASLWWWRRSGSASATSLPSGPATWAPWT